MCHYYILRPCISHAHWYPNESSSITVPVPVKGCNHLNSGICSATFHLEEHEEDGEVLMECNSCIGAREHYGDQLRVRKQAL